MAKSALEKYMIKKGKKPAPKVDAQDSSKNYEGMSHLEAATKGKSKIAKENKVTKKRRPQYLD